MNMKEELQSLISRANSPVKCLNLQYSSTGYGTDADVYLLAVEHSLEELWQLLKAIDFDYDNGFGGQHLTGTVWFQNGTWAERGEYDGSEWWDLHSLPSIPENLSAPNFGFHYIEYTHSEDRICDDDEDGLDPWDEYEREPKNY